jgi:hypothetical protein
MTFILSHSLLFQANVFHKQDMLTRLNCLMFTEYLSNWQAKRVGDQNVYLCLRIHFIPQNFGFNLHFEIFQE